MMAGSGDFRRWLGAQICCGDECPTEGACGVREEPHVDALGVEGVLASREELEDLILLEFAKANGAL